jgi:vesicle-associated membrane protein 7
MPIIYALVARGSRVQVEYAATSGNFASIARKILERVQSEGDEPRRSYQFDGHMFHVIVDGDLLFLCMCDSDFGRVLPFQFLGEIRKRWRANRGDNLTISFAGGNVRAHAAR